MTTIHKIVSDIIADKQAKKIIPAGATWLEVFNAAQAYDLDGKQVGHELNTLCARGILESHPTIKGYQMYFLKTNKTENL